MSKYFDNWKFRWDNGRTGWDLGEPHKYIESLYRPLMHDASIPETPKVYIPGCGRAHDAVFFLANGCQVVASDLVQEALDQAKALYGSQAGIEFIVDDCTAEPAEGAREAYDIIYDRAVFCALEPEERTSYVDGCWQRLTPNGYFMSIPFTDVQLPEGKPSGPPFGISMPEFGELLTPAFELVYAEEYCVPSMDGVIQKEAAMLWKKKAR